MEYKSFIRIFVMGLTVFLCACTQGVHSAGKPMPQLTLEHLDPVPLRVGMLKTDNDDGSFTTESFVVSPDQILEQYLHSRFKPNGFDGVLKATIQDASIQHSYEPSRNTLGQYLEVNGYDVYDMTVLFRLEHEDAAGDLRYGTVLTARRIVRVSEHASIAAREKAQVEAMEALFKDLDREVIRVVLGDMKLGISPHHRH